MNGISIISCEPLYVISGLRAFIPIIAFFSIVIITFIIARIKTHNTGDAIDYAALAAIIASIKVVFVCCCTNICYNETEYHKYTVTIDDDVTLGELRSHYKIIEIKDDGSFVITDNLDYNGD